MKCESTLVLQALLILGLCADVFSFNFQFFPPSTPSRRRSPVPVVQERRYGPVLTVQDPISGCNVHLIGVSHGAQESAELVDRVISDLKPAAVVTELCEERFLSISLESKIRPRGDKAMGEWFDEKSKALEADSTKTNSSLLKSRATSVLNFVRSQGIISGLFVLLGLSVYSVQKAVRIGAVTSKGDEFVTAMRAAERLGVPLLLGDAPQADTLNSVKSVLSWSLFDLDAIKRGGLALRFSVFGAGALESNKELAEKVGKDVLQKSEWLSIPQTYAQNTAMLKGLSPLLAVYAVTLALGFLLPEPAGMIPPADATSGFLLPGLSSSLSVELPESLQQIGDAAIDLFSILLLIRLTKIIGTDRDLIIADKVQAFCKDYPAGTSIVVVIGMLHANGVARWLASGEKPTPT